MIAYAVHVGARLVGTFEFDCDTQSYLCKTLKRARELVEETIEEYMYSVDPPYTRAEALEDLQEITIYKVTLEKVR